MGLTSSDWQLIQERTSRMIREAMINAQRGLLAGPVFRPGTVAAQAGDYINVRADGDSDTINAINASGLSLPAGARVMLVFVPPHGVFASGLIGTMATSWVPVTYANGWTDFGGGYRGAEYMRDAFGIVHFRGAVAAGGASTINVALPVGFRPVGGGMVFAQMATGGSVNQVQVHTDGTITDDVALPSFLSLDGITYEADA